MFALSVSAAAITSAKTSPIFGADGGTSAADARKGQPGISTRPKSPGNKQLQTHILTRLRAGSLFNSASAAAMWINLCTNKLFSGGALSNTSKRHTFLPMFERTRIYVDVDIQVN
jgi:hypothetical protein